MSRGRLARRLLILCCCLLLPTGAGAGQANAFIYHRFGEPRYPSTNIATEVFAAQLRLLHQEGVAVLPLSEVVARLERGADLPERCAVLTVDDAFRSFLNTAMPVLRQYRYPLTLFVSTDSVGHGDYLSWDELRALQAEGIEIGSHTASHDSLLSKRPGEAPNAWLERLRRDVQRAQLALTRELGRTPRLFAYPYGETTPETARLIRELGFAGAAVQHSGVIWAQSDRYQLPRFPMGGSSATLESFRDKLRLRPLPVTVVAPASGLVAGSVAPELVVDIAPAPGVDFTRLVAFVDGKPVKLLRDSSVAGRYRFRAERALTERRSKYTLTAPGPRGEWYWFTFLWIRAADRERG